MTGVQGGVQGGGGGGGGGVDSPQTGSFAVQLTGIEPVATTFDWILFGGIVTITCRQSGQDISNSTNLEIPPGSLPVVIRPALVKVTACPVNNDNSLRIGRADIASAGAGGAGGVLFLVPNADGHLNPEGFSPTGLKGLPLGCVFSYPL